MNDTLLLVHSVLRWAILLSALWAVFRAWKGVSSNAPFAAADNKAGLFFLIFMDLQLLIGLVVYFTSPLVTAARANMGAAMKDPALRFFSLEHVLLAVVALVLVHIGRSKVKKAPTDAAKHKKALIFFGLALLVLLLMIPWPFRAALGRGWI
ncbi:hypothetical protein KTO58_00840 [Chitinophaga pendula]|uniref:hypothetical protein n=1 Tax=Chitinophaga TaxID=79328 RepID=UPI000BAF213D|nr:MULTISPECIES: hypothetical protein [Chitinophaga]ASZ14596.1 hypothetical protein CK934_28405 [Chitinophaga sp. MD30]UCJ07751.1 hypothetical protein KTO58_00840 [Chitinophaga pendula]